MNEIKDKLSFAMPATSVIDDIKAKLSSASLASSAKVASSFVDEHIMNANKLASFTPNSFVKGIQTQLSSTLDIGMKKVDKMLDSVWMSDVLPMRELLVVSQAFLVLYGFFGGVPILSEAVSFIFGPCLMALGSGTVVLGLEDKGGIHFSPLTASENLATDGIYSKVRHPIYAGILAIMTGFCIVMGSVPSLVLSAALWYGLDQRTNFEEAELLKEHGAEYETYQKRVPGKFLPQESLSFLPRMDGESSVQC